MSFMYKSGQKTGLVFKLEYLKQCRIAVNYIHSAVFLEIRPHSILNFVKFCFIDHFILNIFFS